MGLTCLGLSSHYKLFPKLPSNSQALGSPLKNDLTQNNVLYTLAVGFLLQGHDQIEGKHYNFSFLWVDKTDSRHIFLASSYYQM